LPLLNFQILRRFAQCQPRRQSVFLRM